MKALSHIQAVTGEPNTPIPAAEQRAQDSGVMQRRVKGADIGSRRTGLTVREDVNCASPPGSQNSATVRFFKGMPRHPKGKKRFG